MEDITNDLLDAVIAHEMNDRELFLEFNEQWFKSTEGGAKIWQEAVNKLADDKAAFKLRKGDGK